MSAPATTGWIDCETAAKRSGRNAGHWRRLCADAKRAGPEGTLASRGLAKLEAPAEGGKARWLIAETADPTLSAVKFPEQLDHAADLRHVQRAKRDEAGRRRQILQGWEEAKRGGFRLGFKEQQVTAQYLQRLELDAGLKLSRRTLYNWDEAWRARGLAGLVDGRGRAPGDVQQFPFFQELKRHYLSLRRPSKQVCYQLALSMAADQQWPDADVPSYRSACRYLDAIPRAVVLKHRFGDEAYTNEAEPFIRRDYSTLRSNEQWCGDHHQFDVVVRDGTCGQQPRLVRPWLTAWMDMRSRKIVGWKIFGHDPNGDTILAAFKAGCLDAGVPEGVYVDNGKDYDSYALHGRTKKDRWQRRRCTVALDEGHAAGVFAALGVQATMCWAYHGQSKPIERFFGTLEDRFCRLLPTYCGNSPANKPEDLQLRLERGQAPTLHEFTARFADWLDVDYHRQPHSGDGMDGRSPAAVFDAHLESKRTAPPELLELLLLRPTKPVKVTQNGVVWQGLSYGRGEPALFELLGKEVFLRIDDANLQRVTVWRAEGGKDTFVCVAHANRSVPANATSQELREAIAEKRRHRRTLKDYHQVRPRLAEDLADSLLRGRMRAGSTRDPQRAANEANNRPPAPTQEPPPPPSLKPIQTPLADQLKKLRESLEQEKLRPAVGAESMGLGDVRARLREAADEAATASRPRRQDLAALREAFRQE